MASNWSKEDLEHVSVGADRSHIRNLSSVFENVHEEVMMEKFCSRLPNMRVVDVDIRNVKVRLDRGQSTPYQEYNRVLELWHARSGRAATFGVILDILQDSDVLWTRAVDEILAFKGWIGVAKFLTGTLKDSVRDEDMIGSSKNAEKLEASRTMVRRTEPPPPPGSHLPENVTYVKIGKLAYADHFQIGIGNHGFVCHGYFETPQTKAAIKIIGSAFSTVYRNEMAILRQLYHPNIVRIFCTETSGTSHYIAMELADVNLDIHVKEQHPKMQEVLSYLSQISEGLQYMHEKNILHRDIKPSNILLTFPNKSGYRVAKINGFGISKHLQPEASTAKGTSIYMSPECIFAWDASRPFLSRKESDMYSLGLTFFYALTNGQHAAGSPARQLSNLLKGKISLDILKQPEMITHFHLVKSLLQYSIEKRPTISTVVEHPSFWKPEKSLQFITEVSNFLSALDGTRDQFNQVLEDRYKRSRFWVEDWTAQLCPIAEAFVRDRNSKIKNPKKYDGSEIIKLVEFIRDKDNHYGDWSAELKDASVFGDGPNGNSIFIRYFLDRFPFLIILLYIELQPYATDGQLGQFYSNRYHYYDYPESSWSLSFDALC